MSAKQAQYSTEMDSMGMLPGYQPERTQSAPDWLPWAGLAAGGLAIGGGVAGLRGLKNVFKRKPIPKPPIDPKGAWEAEVSKRIGPEAMGSVQPKMGSVQTPSIVIGLGQIARGQ
jgi:hypothetical protein